MKLLPIHTNLSVIVIVRLPHPRRGDGQVKKLFYHRLLTRKIPDMTKSAKITIPLYQH